jgi:hypothetical protein
MAVDEWYRDQQLLAVWDDDGIGDVEIVSESVESGWCRTGPDPNSDPDADRRENTEETSWWPGASRARPP